MHIIEIVIRQLKALLPVGKPREGRNIVSALYTALLECITLGQGIPRSINREPVLRFSPWLRCLGNSYEPEVHAWLKQHVKAGDQVIDVGAQIGIHAMILARWVGRSGKIHAFEPSPEGVRTLRRHLRLNRLENQVNVVECALGDSEGNAVLHMAGSNPINTLAAPNSPDVLGMRVDVRVDRLDRYCAAKGVHPSMVKIDTEGWEYYILKGAGAMLRDERVHFVVEMHPFAWGNAGYSREEFERFFEANQIQAVPLTGQTDPMGEYGDVWLRRI